VGAVAPFAFTYGILTGRIGNYVGHDDQLCYETKGAAVAALNEWSGVGQPAGWSRHPGSGRGRPNECGGSS
jgi:hypothetical protein